MDSAGVEHKGEWWLPERPNRRVPGILRISDEGRCVLELLGEMRPLHELVDMSQSGTDTVITFTDKHFDAAGHVRRLHGQVGATAWTLENCGRVHHNRNLMGGLPHEQFSVQVAFKGCWYESDEIPGGDRLLAQVQWLSYWIGNAIEETNSFDTESNRLQGITISARSRPTETAQVEDGCEIRLHHGFSSNGDRIGERTLRNEQWMEIRYEDVQPLEVLAHRLGTLQPLITIAVDRPTGYLALKLQHPELRDGPQGEYRQSIEYIANWSLRDRKEQPLRWTDVIFKLEDFGGIQALPAWMGVAEKYHEPLSRAMARHQRDMFVNDQVFHSAAALEGFHKIARPGLEMSLLGRLLACASLGGEAFSQVVGDTGEWARLLKEERNEIGHGGLGHLPPDHMLYLASVSFYLLELCLLREAGAPDIVFTKLGSSPRGRWLTETMADVIPAASTVEGGGT